MDGSGRLVPTNFITSCIAKTATLRQLGKTSTPEASGFNKEPGTWMLRRVGSPPWSLKLLLQETKEKYPQNPAREGAQEGFARTDQDGTRTWNGIRTTTQWNNVRYARTST